MNIKFDLVVPALLKDASKVLGNLDYINEYIDYDNLVLVGNDEVEELVKKYKNKRIKFINENKLLKDLNYSSVKKLIDARGGDVKRTGWYLQQFIKLSYAYVCKHDYYMTWDSDTMPVRKVEMFNKKKPFFDLKKEYHKPYFDTIKSLLGIDRVVNKSFISEHMMFNKKFFLFRDRSRHFVHKNGS